MLDFYLIDGDAVRVLRKDWWLIVYIYQEYSKVEGQLEKKRPSLFKILNTYFAIAIHMHIYIYI